MTNLKLVPLLLVLLAACSPATTTCTPGTTTECICPDSRSGAQSCNAEGSGFDTCACTGSDGGVPDADVRADASGRDGDVSPRDAGEPRDAGDFDAGTDSGSDTGTDAGPPSATCPAGYYHDVPSSRCYITRPIAGPTLCPVPDEPIRWATLAEQLRLQALLVGMYGNYGTGVVRRGFISSGPWQFADGSAPPPLSWAPGSPAAVPYSFFSAAGLVSTHRAPSTYFCMTDAS